MIGLGGLLILSAGGLAASVKLYSNSGITKQPPIRLSDLLNSKALATVEAQEVDAALHVPLDAHHSDTIDPIGVGADIVNSDREAIDTDDVPEEKSNSDADEMELSSAARRLIASTGGVGLAIGSSMGAPWLAPISLFTTVALAAPIFRDAYRATVEEKKLKVDVLDTAIISLCLIFRKFGPAAFMVWILDLADLLLDKTTERSREYVTEVFGEQPRSAWLLVDGKEIQVPVTTLKRGDEIVVGTGEQVPVDGIVLDGDAMIDQQSLTGEAAPAEKRKGDQVFAMTVVVAGQIYVEVTETGENTLAAQIIQIVNDAAAFKVDVQSRGERIADDMVLPTFGLGAVAYLFSGTSALLATINADYGTGIRVAAPIALLASLGNAAKNGILVKDSKVFELLSDIDVVLFDKTGTLTYDVPIVSQIVPANGSINPDTLLFYAAAAEQKFSHPIAKAILQEAEQKSMMLPVLDESTYHVGFGIQVSLDDRVIKIGSSRYMDREGISMPPLIHETLQESRLRGNSAILIAIEDEVAGMIEMQSTPREEATHVIDFLKTQGISEIVLISGDHEAPTQELARQLDIPQFVAGVLPHEKADYVRSYQTDGKKVMMVGDGINDSAALSLADVSISLKGASTIAVDVADVIFMDGSLRRFDYLYTVTKKLDRNVRRSFSMIAIPNTLCITGAILGLFGLSGSLILNNGFNILAAFNGMLLHIGQDTESQAQQTNKQPLNL